MPYNTLHIYTDGGARGNPGPAAIGAVIGEKKYSAYIGETTNNVAEYRAIIFALEKTYELMGISAAKETTIDIRTDSQLIARQARGEYKIKQPHLKELHAHLMRAIQPFKEVRFIEIPREENKEADRLVNEALDKNTS